MKAIHLLALPAFFFPTPCESAEMRTWMSRLGSTLEASLESVRAGEVRLVSSDGRQLTLRAADLSIGDRQYLVEFGGADDAILSSGDPGQPEREVRPDTRSFTMLPDKIMIPGISDLEFKLLETPHFLVGANGRTNQKAIAETAERLWHGMAFQHMNFRKDWGDRKALVLLVEGDEAYKALGDWYVKELTDGGNEDAAARVAATWPQIGSTRIPIPADLSGGRGLFPHAQVFRVRDDRAFAKEMNPFPVHALSAMLLETQLGQVDNQSAPGYFAIATGHAYYKEINLAGKSETNLLAVDGSANDEISSKSGFQDGTSWARSLRPLVRREKVKPDLNELLAWQAVDLNPERLVLIYSFSYYMQSDAKRLASYANLVRRVESSKQIPPVGEIAAIFGFDSAEKFQADWVEFISGNSFK